MKTLCRLMLALATALTATAAPTMPETLAKGDVVALVSPSSSIDTARVERLAAVVDSLGFQPRLAPHALCDPTRPFAADATEIAAAINSLVADTLVKAIVCTRGGYGAVRALDLLDARQMAAHPTWIVGYSDITVLHAFAAHCGVPSIHGRMYELGRQPDAEASRQVWQALADPYSLRHDIPAHPYNKQGKAIGVIRGGNLVTFNELAQTPFDILAAAYRVPTILFIEEVGENIHTVERILTRLHLSGQLAALRGLIVGQFTNYEPEKGYERMEDMIHERLSRWGYYEPGIGPDVIVFDFPAGHIDDNRPLVFNLGACVSADSHGVHLYYPRPASQR